MDGIWHSSRRPGAAHPIWVRPLDSVQAQPLAVTEGASFPFWSPDGRFIAFFAAGKLRRGHQGGTPQTLADAPTGRGGTWSGDDVILFSGQPSSPISRIPASGGTVRPVTTFDAAQGTSRHWPQFLPDGRHFLYYQRSAKAEHQGTYVTALDSSQSTRVLEIAGRAVYASGHLLFVRDGILFAQAFDDRALRTSGEPIRVADGVGYWASTFAYTAVTASASGVLAHGPSVVIPTSLRWHDRGGATIGPPTTARAYGSPRLSPDQTSVLVAITDATTAQPDLWLLAPARGTSSRVTSDPSSDWFPVWSHDGSGMFFGSPRLGSTTIFQKGAVSPEVVFADSVLVSLATYPNDVSQDGQFLLYQSTSRGYDLGVIRSRAIANRSRLSAAHPTKCKVASRQTTGGSPTRRMNRFEVHVRPFPQSTRPTTISVAGGMQPEWRRDGSSSTFRRMES